MKKTSVQISKRVHIDILFGLLYILIFLRYGLEINIPTSLFLCISLLIITFGNNYEIITMCLCCVPLHSSFDYLYVALYGCVVLVLKNFKKIKIDYVSIFVMIIIFWELLHSINNVFSIKSFIALVCPYSLVLSIHWCRKTKIDYRYISTMYSYFVMLQGINLFFRTLKLYSFNFSLAIQQMERLGNLTETTIVGGQINPNSLGIMCVLAITMLLQSYLYIKKDKKIVFLILVLFLIGILTLSKTYIVLFLLSVLLFMCEQKTKTVDKIKTIMIISSVAIFGGLLLANLFPNIVESFVKRWSVIDLSSGRIDIMTISEKAMQSNPKLLWFGIGLQNYFVNVLEYVYFAPHDAFHEIIFAWGLPGLILFISFIISLVIEAIKYNKHIRLVNFIPLIIIVAKSIAGHLITSNYTMLTISLVYVSMLYDFRL